MSKKASKDDALSIVEQVVSAIQEKKAKKIITIDLSEISSSVTGYFVICHAPSKTQVNAIYDNVVKLVRENCNAKPFYREGYENSEWILIDYFDVIVRVFLEDIRTFYNLEDLWADGRQETHESDE